MKPNAYCLFKNYNNDITIYSFFTKDKKIKRKSLRLKNNHKHVNPDAMVLGNVKDPKPGKAESKIGALSLEQFS